MVIMATSHAQPSDGNSVPMKGDLGVPLLTRLRMEHACLQFLADRADVRILHIKGEAWHPTLAEGRPPSSDADVLVAPTDVRRYEKALTETGWELFTSFAHGSVFRHAATYYHPVWGTVDLHQHFPGLDRDPALTFDTFWDTREQVELGGYPVNVPGLLEQRVLMLTHAARDAMGRGARDARVAWDDASEDEKAQIDALAEKLGARVPVALVSGRPERATGQPGAHLWEALHRNAHPTEVWQARLADARGVIGHARVLVEALRVNPDHLALRLGHRPDAREIRREWFARWGRAIPRLVGTGRRGLRTKLGRS